jgi:transketolase
MVADDARMVNTLRFLSVDMVEKANSGHPGLPLDAAPMAYVLWDRFLRHNPHNPGWWDRDRFILSAGHGSALLYSLLHVTGYDLPLSELEQFRRYGSKTPGHPEVHHTPGVEATTGPLGQGFAMGIGMALASRFLAGWFNRPEFPVFDHWTYGICSDGDLMEGIASEAASFAGSMHVGRLIYLYDDNHISLEGPTSLSFTEDVGARFRSYGWGVAAVEDGNDLDAIEAAIREARSQPDQPWLIRVRTHIGYGSPKQDTKDAHGEALGAAAVRATKEKLGWPLEPTFLVPDDVRERFGQAVPRGAAAEAAWEALLVRYRAAFPTEAAELDRLRRGELPGRWDAELPVFPADPAGVATRDAGAKAMNAIASHLPELVGGSADLAPSTKTLLDGAGNWSATGACGRNLHFGVRENAMVGMVNGMALHGGVVAYGATFLIFSDYARPAIRLAALQGTHTLLVFTHDSIALGEDGPSHQPVEHLAALRAIPGLTVLRPADANETVEAWRVAVQRKGPVALVFTRQKVPTLEVPLERLRAGVSQGAYVVAETPGRPPQVVLIGTGSEVALCLRAAKALEGDGHGVRTVSMPSWELFDESAPEYRSSILPAGVPRVSVEAASPLGWERYVGRREAIVGLDRFGASAPGSVVLEQLGFTVEHIRRVAKEQIARARSGTAP